MSRKAIPAPGTYQARRGGKMVVYESPSGSLCVAVPIILLFSEVNWSGKTTVTLAKSDGTLQTKRIDEMKRIFGWDGVDPFALEDIEPTEEGTAEFEVVGEHEPYVPEGETEAVETFKIKWINPLGGSTNMPAPVEDRKSVLSKWGSKFKANAGGAAVRPAAAPAKKPAAAPAAPAAPSTPPARPAAGGPPSRKSSAAVARTCTQDEVWELYEKANPDMDADALGVKYWEAADSVKQGGELSLQEWGQVATRLGV